MNPIEDQAIKTARRDYWLVPIAVAVLGAAAALAYGAWIGSFGFSFALLVPTVLGFTLGYAVRAGRGTMMLLACVVLLLLLGGAIWAGLAGLLCGFILLVVALVPTLCGALVGRLMRRRLARADLRSSDYSALLLLFVLAGGAMEIEAHFTPPFQPEMVTTRRTLDMSPWRAWDRLAFYEEVSLQPPMLTRLLLPVPLRTEGRLTGSGDIKRCIYTSGYLRKRITHFEPTRELAFDVIEQSGVEDRSVELISGSFRFERLSDGTTDVVLTTVYRPKLQARWIWRPFETAVAHSLHRHVLDGMEAQGEHFQQLIAEVPTL